jgi:hypothetical protein
LLDDFGLNRSLRQKATPSRLRSQPIGVLHEHFSQHLKLPYLLNKYDFWQFRDRAKRV